MKKKSTSQSAPARLGEGGFFNLRVLIGLFIGLAGVFLALLGFGAFSNASAQSKASSKNLAGQTQQAIGRRIGEMTVISAVHSDLSPPLRDQPVVWPQRERREPPEHRKIPFKHKGAPDPVIQSSFWQSLVTSPAIPAPIRKFAGINKPCHGCADGIPPDTNGEVGKTQYVEMVNEALQVFDKLTGTSLLGPFPIDSVWFGFGGACQVNTEGDPVVVYDRLADRWIISQFAKPAGATDPQDECIAVSQTGDATGAWYRYDFHLTGRFSDYPKFGVWPDGYYMSANTFRTGCAVCQPCFLGPQPFVFDRAKMLVGDPTATAQTPGLIGPGIPGGDNNETPFLPSDLDGILPPPLGDPNHFVQVSGEESPVPRLFYRVWAFHVDWNQPADSSFTLQASVPAAGFTALCTELICPDDNCVPQKGTEAKLDSLSPQLMFRNAYRRFPDGRESLLNNFTVSANSMAGIRWFELGRRVPGNWTLRQEKTYQPDSTWRWMGSIASDNQGNIALGFSASSATIYPQIRYAGRLATDPLSILSGEQHLFDGTGSQTDSRWGDYSDMTVDPVDDCTFYYTNEYYEVTNEDDNNWHTRIGYFRFAQCTPPQKGTGHFVVRFVCDPGTPVSNASVSIDGFSYGATLADGTYDAVLPPGSHSYVVSSSAFATQTGNFTVTNGQTTTVGVCLAGKAALGNISARAFVQTGDNVMIGGFMVQGTEPKRVIIRAIGPELTQYGVPDALANPTLELYDGAGALIASNNTWLHTIIGGIITSNQVGEIQASGHAPGDPRESAIIADLRAGNYTAIVRGVNNTTGVALVEVYNLSPETNSILGNISARSFVQTGDNVMIGGFMVQGIEPKRVIIRAIGPELTQYGVPDALADPTLELYDGAGALIGSNNTWLHTIIGGIITAPQVRDILDSGYAPGDPRESAIIADLPVGNYTAIVRGVNDTTGVALVEVYDLQ